MGNSYSNADHGVILKIIDTKFNDIWIYTRFTEHLPAIYAGSIDMPAIVGTAYARYSSLKDMETAVFKYTHTIIKKDEPPAKAPAAPAAPSAKPVPSATPATLTTLVKSVTVESVTLVDPKTADEQKLETWWSSRCVGVNHAVCEACKQMDADSKTADIHKYKYIYKTDRAEYNNTLSHGLNTMSPIIWSPRNPNHYAYVMGMFHNTIKDLPADKQKAILQHFDLHTINRRWWKSSVVSHIKNSVDYANTLFFGIPANNWYDQWWFKTTERVITWTLMIHAIFAIVIVYIDVKSLSNSISSISGDVSIFSKRVAYNSANTAPANAMQ